jgi:DNA helicase-2/ATP-dependent DNA helicase PcrA
MEEMECTDLVKTSKMLDAGSAAECAIAMVEFASLCMTKVKSELSLLVAKLSEGREPTVRVGSATEEAASAVIAMSRSEGLDCPLALTALLRMQELPGVKIFRRELLNEMQKALKSVRDGAFSCMSDAAWAIRDQARHQVRTLDYRLISRALLVKGLEFDHCIVLNADEWNAKELYVAITRGSRSLTVLTSDGEEIVTYSGAT